MLFQALRDHVMYNYGYYQGRIMSLSTSLSKSYLLMLSELSSLITLPLPLLSLLTVPFFGSSSTSISLAFFFLTWSTLVLSHDPLHIEIVGTLSIRFMFFLLPSLAVLAFDLVLPSLSTSIKARGEAQLPGELGSRKLRRLVAVSIFNVLLEIAVQSAFEAFLTEVLHFRSGLRVSSIPPMPWPIAKDLFYGLFFRGILHYVIHQHLLHASPQHSPLARWHKNWAHSIKLPFSLAATYDQPICHLLAHWVPLYLPALIFRFHVLTWFLLLAFDSLEQFFTYSGYAVLPSSILLSGMARRTDAHHATAGKGNFGHWGVLDWVLSTGCPGEADVVDNVQDEVEKRDVRSRVSNAAGKAGDRFNDDEEEHESNPSQSRRRSKRQAAKSADAS